VRIFTLSIWPSCLSIPFISAASFKHFCPAINTVTFRNHKRGPLPDHFHLYRRAGQLILTHHRSHLYRICFQHYVPSIKYTADIMKYLITAIAAVVATASTIAAQGCAAGTAKEENGNWYCSAVQAISYTNMGTPGSYDKVTTMENGNCASTPQGYGGGISPLDEEVCATRLTLCGG
jgi:Glycine-rich protein domain (DUF2403)